MKLSDLFEAKLSKWEVSVETGPYQYVTITVNAVDKADAEKKAMAEAKRRKLNSPMLGQAKLIKEAGESSPFRKNQKVVLSDKGLLGTVESVSKAWEYFTVKFVDGRHADVNFNQAHKLKKFTGQMVTAKQNAEISELLQYGNDPEEVAKIMRVPIDTVLQLKPEKTFTEATKAPLVPQLGMGDSRSARELKDQITNGSDEFVKDLANSKESIMNSKILNMQIRLAKTEWAKRQKTKVTEGQYEMMLSNGSVKKFVAKDDKDAKRIAKGYGAKSVIKLKGGVPAGKLSEGKMRKESASDIFYRYEKLKKSFVNPTPEQKKMLDNVLAMATAAMDEQFKKTQSNLEAKFAGSDWWEEVKKMYKVKEEGNKWVVVSNARDWKQTKDWEFDTKYEALEQLEKLVKYKAADRKAGKGDVEKDFERVDALRKREQA